MKKFFAYIILALSISGCKFDQPPVPSSITNTDHYVHGYWIFDDVDIEVGSSGHLQNGYNMPLLKIKPSESAYLVSYLSVDDRLEEYYALCRRYNDFSYDPFGGYKYTENEYYFVNYPLRIFSSFDFSSIDIVSDKDFDETHPAGVSLADIVMLSTFWGRPELDHYYHSKTRGSFYNGSWFYEGFSYGQLLFERLDALTSYELSLIGMQSSSANEDNYESRSRETFCIGALTFADAPTQEMEHTFTVTLTTVDGAELTAEAYVRWD